MWLCAGVASATPYASALIRTGNTVSFILNEDADTVTITRDGGNEIVLVNPSAGSHTFDITGFGGYSIGVARNTTPGWVESSVSAGNPLMSFNRVNGLAVNQNPGSQYFGRFYVSHGRELPSPYGRTMGDGVYVFNADGTDIGGITDPNDTSAARQAGLGAYFTASSGSPFRIEVGEDDALYIGDRSNTNGGMFITDPDVISGRLLLADLGGNEIIVNGTPGQNHGSIISTPVIKGSLEGGDLQLWTIDENLQASVPGHAQHFWRYDIGSDPGIGGYAGPAVLEIDADLTGPYDNGHNSDGSRIFFPDVPGVDVDLTYDPVHDNFIVTQRRNDGNESCLVIYNGDFSQMLFNSRQFSIDHNLDGAESDILQPSLDGIQDIFRAAGDAVVSPDGSFVVISRGVVGDATIHGVNDYFGPAGLLNVPLDADGLPILDLSGANAVQNGVPDNLMLGLTGIELTGAAGIRPPVAIDLAGNIYHASSNTGLVRVFSPGGDSIAITRSDGTFLLIPEPAGITVIALGMTVLRRRSR
jgi:hypothetical protein